MVTLQITRQNNPPEKLNQIAELVRDYLRPDVTHHSEFYEHGQTRSNLLAQRDGVFIAHQFVSDLLDGRQIPSFLYTTISGNDPFTVLNVVNFFKELYQEQQRDN